MSKNRKCFDSLSQINLELSSKCNKVPGCWMCGRRKIEKDYPELAKWGDMEFSLVEKISKQLPPNIVVAFHWNGEPTVYNKLGDALGLFKNQIRQFDTNGILIVEKEEEIINNLDIMTISVIENDPIGDEQYEIVKQFLDIRGNNKPNLVYRLLGNVEKSKRWYNLPGTVCTRIIHAPMGSFNYEKKVTIPEIGICTEILNKMAIDRFGDVSICVRFDPLRLGVLGNVYDTSLLDIWNSDKRKEWINYHTMGMRYKVPLCSYCSYWGVPTGL